MTDAPRDSIPVTNVARPLLPTRDAESGGGIDRFHVEQRGVALGRGSVAGRMPLYAVVKLPVALS